MKNIECLHKEELVNLYARLLQVNPAATKKTLDVCWNIITEMRTEGMDVELRKDFGRFMLKMRDDSSFSLLSSKTPKKTHYTISFKAGRELKNMLKIG